MKSAELAPTTSPGGHRERARSEVRARDRTLSLRKLVASAEGVGQRVRDASDVDASAAMARYASGERAAFAELYEQLAPRLHRLCRRLAGPDADELLQEVFLKVHRARKTFTEGGSVTAWAFAIARTTCWDRRRYLGRRPEASVDPSQLERQPTLARAGCPESAFWARTLARLLDEELEQSTETLRAAYVLVKLEGLSCREAGELLGATDVAIKQRVHRASEALKPALTAAGW